MQREVHDTAIPLRHHRVSSFKVPTLLSLMGLQSFNLLPLVKYALNDHARLSAGYWPFGKNAVAPSKSCERPFGHFSPLLLEVHLPSSCFSPSLALFSDGGVKGIRTNPQKIGLGRGRTIRRRRRRGGGKSGVCNNG